MYLSAKGILLQKLSSSVLTEKGITLSILRLDTIHKEVSGNKIFKLHFFIEECLKSSQKKILTFGGAYSNHLAATAFECADKNIACVGIVRGEEPKVLSHTLLRCKELGMKLVFVDRHNYAILPNTIGHQLLKNDYADYTIIPEGGYDKKGADGASLIMDIVNKYAPTHVCTCVGTGTTLAGLVQNNPKNIEIIAVPVIKNMTDINDRILYLTSRNYSHTIWSEYHFGGYAKYNEELLNFMNTFFTETTIPLDFVYTAKMMYGMLDKIKKNYFEKGSNIICLHTGGLQGNYSLEKNKLIF